MSELAQIKSAVDAVNTTFTEFKKTNDERIKQLEEKGRVDPDLEAKLSKINTDLDALSTRVTELKRLPQPGATGAGGKQLSAEEQEHKTQFNAWARKGRNESELMTAQGKVQEFKAMSVGSDPDGGYFVPPDTSGRLSQILYESSPIRQVAAVQTISVDALEGPTDDDEVTSGWVGEMESRSETTTPRRGMWRIEAHEQYAKPKITQKLLDDAQYDVEGWLAKKVADKLGREENSAFVNGDGVAKPRGFLTYPDGTGRGYIKRVKSGANGAFAAADPGDKLIDVVYTIKNAYRANAHWMLSRLTLGEIRKLKDGQDNYLWQPDFTQKGNGKLLGYNIVEAEDMPEIAAGSLSIAFGDFREAYQIVDRIGIRVLRDPYSNKPFVEFYTTKRVGGDVVTYEALVLMEFSA